MDFFKRQWAAVTLIVIAAFWIGIRMSTESCPSCVVGKLAKDMIGEEETRTVAETPDIVPAMASWNATDILGVPVSSETVRGKVGVFVYWATWCGGCKKEIPDLVALREEFSPDQVEIIGLSVDEGHKDLIAYAEQRGINYRIVRVTDSVREAFGPVDSIPTLIILDREGRVQFRHTGIVEKDAIAERVKALLPKGGKGNFVASR